MNMGGFYNGNQNPLFRELATDVIGNGTFIFIGGGRTGKHTRSLPAKRKIIHPSYQYRRPHNNPNVLVYDEVAALKNTGKSGFTQKTNCCFIAAGQHGGRAALY